MDNVTRLLMQGAAGAAGGGTYVDDVFSTYVYKGNNGSHTITNGIDNSEGGLLWTKARTVGESHTLFDTERASNKAIYTNLAERDETRNFGLNFLSDGFSWNTSDGMVNNASHNYVAWNFRKQKGFFDIVTYTGNGSNRTISHSLESVPGCIMVKSLDDNEWWAVYHRQLNGGSNPEQYYLRLNTNNGETTSADLWNNTAPTSTNFSLGSGNAVNKNGDNYVAYLFAGGESTAETARSVNLGTTGWMNTPATSDFAFGTGDFTVECWVKFDDPSTNGGIWNIATGTGLAGVSSQAVGWNGSNWTLYANGETSTTHPNPTYAGLWYHTAYVRHNNTVTLYVNGKEVIKATDSTNWSTNTALAIGGYYSSSYTHDGKISNLRVVKGTAVYTSAFRPPTQPLTNITNTTMLCCNNSSVTGKTVGPSITSWGPTASTDSPFDDPEGFQFGKDEDQNIIKCGYYTGVPGYPVNFDVEIGWEPQFFMVKNLGSGTNEWLMWDSMRGVAAQIAPNDGGNDARLSPTESATEYNGDDQIEFHPTGVRVTTNDGRVNGGTGARLIYIAIRRPDGYVGKPAKVGTDVFAMDAGAGSSTIPNFDSGFPVDFAFEKTIAGGNSWSTGARLIQNRYLYINTNMAEGAWDKMVFDSNTGWNDHSSYGSGDQSWMWKRGAGFDVVTYVGNEYNLRQIPHSLGKTPEMMWLKYRGPSGYNEDWQVYHKGLNGGVNPQDYAIRLDSDGAEYNSSNDWGDTAPTSTHFTIGGSDGRNNRDGSSYINILFASVDGISKVGYYDGSDSPQTITTGFQPRFLIVRRTNTNGSWYMIDTVRGWSSGNDPYLRLNSGNAQLSDTEFGTPTATGFTLDGNHFMFNDAGDKFIYYAHA